MDTGAYFVPLATCFSFPRPAIVSVKNGQMELIRRPETFEDLVSRDDVRRPSLRRLTARIEEVRQVFSMAAYVRAVPAARAAPELERHGVSRRQRSNSAQ